MLTAYQHLVLLAASAVDMLPRMAVIPNGVYRSLMCRGLLVPRGEYYEITPEGRDVLAQFAGRGATYLQAAE